MNDLKEYRGGKSVRKKREERIKIVTKKGETKKGPKEEQKLIGKKYKESGLIMWS